MYFCRYIQNIFKVTFADDWAKINKIYIYVCICIVLSVQRNEKNSDEIYDYKSIINIDLCKKK